MIISDEYSVIKKSGKACYGIYNIEKDNKIKRVIIPDTKCLVELALLTINDQFTSRIYAFPTTHQAYYFRGSKLLDTYTISNIFENNIIEMNLPRIILDPIQMLLDEDITTPRTMFNVEK